MAQGMKHRAPERTSDGAEHRNAARRGERRGTERDAARSGMPHGKMPHGDMSRRGKPDAPARRRLTLADQWRTVPNIVTMTRIVLVVVFLIVLSLAGADGHHSLAARWWGFGLFTLAALSDKLDGYLARRYDMVTDLGKLLDPIADKLLVCGALVVLAAFGELNPGGWIITALFLVRELGITVMRLFVLDTDGLVIAANQAGKLKTLFECVGLGMLIFPMWSIVTRGGAFERAYYWLTYAVILVALVLCLYSGAVYVLQVLRARRMADHDGGPDRSHDGGRNGGRDAHDAGGRRRRV